MSLSYTIFASILFLFLFSNNSNSEDLVKLYPNDDFKKIIPLNKSENRMEWQDFIDHNGKWELSIDKITNTPVIAYGKPIKIMPSDISDKEIVAEYSKKFLFQNQKLFNIEVDKIRLSRVDNVLDKWYVTFNQFEDSIEVLMSEINLTINSEGCVFAFNISFYKNIEFPKKNKIDISKAIDITNKSLNIVNDKKNINKLQSKNSGTEYIIPVYKENKIEFKKVYQIISSTNEREIYETFVDVYDGIIIWQKNNLLTEFKSVKLVGKTIEKFYSDEPVNVDLKQVYLKVDGSNIKTDQDAKIKYSSNNVKKITFEYKSPATNVYISDSMGVYYSPTPIDFDPKLNEFVLNDINSNKYGVFAIYHLNKNKEIIKQIDTNLKCLDRKVDVTFYGMNSNYSEMGENAFYDSKNCAIGFSKYDNTKYQLALCPGVMYHEYGHAINDLFYKERGQLFLSKICHEALADVNLNMILDDPIGTQGIWGDDEKLYIRNSDNKCIFPDSCNGESHNDGRVLAGAFWDLRKLLGRDISFKLMHFAMYSLPNDMNVRIVFKKWLIAVLIADDDNGDLTDGTPHLNQIMEAFGRHNIGANLLLYDSFKFTPLDDLENVKEEQNVTVEFIPNIIPLKKPSNMFLTYYLKKRNQSNIITLNLNENKYECKIKGFENPEIVYYKIEYKDEYTGKTLNIDYDNNVAFYTYLTGYNKILEEQFEENKFYITEYINSGKGFSIIEPDGYNSGRGWSNYHPFEDITLKGTKCLITGKETLIDGSSVVVTPDYTINKTDKAPIISFWIYEYTSFSNKPYKDEQVGFWMYYKLENRPDWVLLYQTNKFFINFVSFDTTSIKLLHNKWKNVIIELPDTLDNDTKIKFMFKASSKVDYPSKYDKDYNYAFLTIGIDDLKIFGEQLTTSTQYKNDSEDIELICYPNPISKHEILSIVSNVETYADIGCYDIFGRNIFHLERYKLEIGKNELTFENCKLEDLNKGSYYLKIIDEKGNQKTLLVVIK